MILAGLDGPQVAAQLALGGQCVWEFGNMGNGANFGTESQYGKVKTVGSFESRIQANPRC